MIFDDFKIGAEPFIHDAFCKCGNKLEQVSNGFLSCSLFCSKCENVYQIRMIKVPKKRLSKEYLEQCRKQTTKDDKE